jgi:hypothetical protein
MTGPARSRKVANHTSVFPNPFLSRVHVTLMPPSVLSKSPVVSVDETHGSSPINRVQVTTLPPASLPHLKKTDIRKQEKLFLYTTVPFSYIKHRDNHLVMLLRQIQKFIGKNKLLGQESEEAKLVN